MSQMLAQRADKARLAYTRLPRKQNDLAFTFYCSRPSLKQQGQLRFAADDWR